MGKFSEILNSDLLNILEEKFNTIPLLPNQDNKIKHRWEDLLFQAQNKNPNEMVLIFEENDRFVIDNNSLTDNRNSISFLESMITNSEIKMYDIFEAFWVELIDKTNYYNLFHKIAIAFLNKINKEGIEETIEWGSTYSAENGIEFLNENLGLLKEKKQFFTFSIHLLIDNHKTNKTKFCDFSFGPNGVYMKIGDEKYISCNIFEVDLITLKTIGNDLKKIDEIADVFIRCFDYYLPIGEGHHNLNRDFIHVIKANFELIDPNRLYLESLQNKKC
jgi:hypothetical protein